MASCIQLSNPTFLSLCSLFADFVSLPLPLIAHLTAETLTSAKQTAANTFPWRNCYPLYIKVVPIPEVISV